MNCQITLLVRNLPRGQNIQLTDLIDPGLGLYVQSANWTGAGVTCTGNGPLAQCFIPTDNLSHDAHFGPGETIPLNYTAVLQAPSGDPRPDQPRENCVRASLPHEGAVVQAPAANGDPNRSYCVPLTLDLEGNAGDALDCSLDTFFVVDKSGSMAAANRMSLTKQAVLAAFASFEGNGSTSGVLTFNSGTQLLGGGTSHTLPSSILQVAVQQISAGGGTGWSTALAEANTLITPMTEKPLVLFITDGRPNSAYGVQPSLPYVATLRAQGSRVLGIAIGQGGYVSTLTDLLGPNLVTTGPGVVVNPMVNDVIHITDSSHIVPSFEQIARAYCPSTQGMTPQQRDALEQAILSMPKSAVVAPDGDDPYFGDEPWPEVTQTPEASAPRKMPELVITKAHSGTCTANRNSQLYDCGFRLSMTNTGTAPFNGPLVVSDSFGNAPAVRSATLLSGGGWSCAGPVSGAVLCETAGLLLLPGASAHLELTMQIEGMRAG